MRSEKQKLANYTELVHAGDGVTIEKGVISASGGSGSGGGVNMNDIPVIVENEDYLEFEDQRTQGEFMDNPPLFLNNYNSIFSLYANGCYSCVSGSATEVGEKRYLPIILLLPEYTSDDDKMMFTSTTYYFEVLENN